MQIVMVYIKLDVITYVCPRYLTTGTQVVQFPRHKCYVYYRKTSSISRTKSQNLNVSCILLQLSSLNLLKPGVQLRMKM